MVIGIDTTLLGADSDGFTFFELGKEEANIFSEHIRKEAEYAEETL